MTTMIATAYEIKITPKNRDLGPVYFMVHPPGESQGVLAHKIPITARDISQYPEIPFNSDWQYLEIGPGISELLPALAKRVRHPPIAIDFADFSMMKSLLEVSNPRRQEKRFEELQRRIQVYTDPTQIRLLNMTLGDAVQDQTIHEVADVVIDISAASTYAETELSREDVQSRRTNLEFILKSRVRAYELSLLKPGGRLILWDRTILKE